MGTLGRRNACMHQSNRPSATQLFCGRLAVVRILCLVPALGLLACSDTAPSLVGRWRLEQMQLHRIECGELGCVREDSVAVPPRLGGYEFRQDSTILIAYEEWTATTSKTVALRPLRYRMRGDTLEIENPLLAGKFIAVWIVRLVGRDTLDLAIGCRGKLKRYYQVTDPYPNQWPDSSCSIRHVMVRQ